MYDRRVTSPWTLRTRACALAGALLLASCGTLAPGAPVAEGETALLRPALRTGQRVRIVEVDGRPLGWLRDRARLAPGTHEVGVEARVTVQGRRARGAHRLRFDAEPGQQYVVDADWYVYGTRVWIRPEAGGPPVAVAETRPPRLPPVGAR